jgi:(2Fe-2S) ferredoxin
MKLESEPKGRIFVCANDKAPGKSQCLIGEGEKCVKWLRQEMASRGLTDKIWVTRSKCQSYCPPNGTVISFEPSRKQYSDVRLEDVPALLEEYLKEFYSIRESK